MSRQNSDQVKTHYLILRIFGLHVSSSAVFKSIGKLANLIVYATSNVVKNEKRYIKLSQSAPFKPNGRPPRYGIKITIIFYSDVLIIFE